MNLSSSNGLRCPACGGAELVDFFTLNGLPTDVGVVWDTAEAARRAPRGDITLTWCPCGFVFNRTFVPRAVTFEPGYEVALSHSEIFCEFMQGVAARLVDRFDLRGKRVIEIGCGAGFFLRLLCLEGGNDGIGFDRTVKKQGIETVGRGTVRFIRDYYAEKYADLECDFICCLSVLEDLPEPTSFLRILRDMIGHRSQIGMYFEVFNAQQAFEKRNTWSIHYEQCNYFSSASFASIFKRAGFGVLDAATCYGDGEYVYVEAVAANGAGSAVYPAGRAAATEATGDKGIDRDLVRLFADEHEAKIKRWSARIETFITKKRRAVVWGTGGKGMSFLNALPSAQAFPYVVDINPDRQGHYVGGTGHLIVAPSFLREYRPQTIVITNPLYSNEIRASVGELGLDCEFLTA